MIEQFRCFDDLPHDAHVFVLTIDFLCSGPFECGNTQNEHKPHRIVKRDTARCPGVFTFLN